MDSQNDEKKIAVDLTKLAAREAARLDQPLEAATKSVLEAYRRSLKQVEASRGDVSEYLRQEYSPDQLRALLEEISAREKSAGSEDPPA